jgi:hypothetical protein
MALTAKRCYEKSKQQRHYLTHKGRMSRPAVKVNDINHIEVLAKDTISSAMRYHRISSCYFFAQVGLSRGGIWLDLHRPQSGPEPEPVVITRINYQGEKRE